MDYLDENTNKKEKYEGDFINNQRSGTGKYWYYDGDYYFGQWYNNMRSGKGKLINNEDGI